VTASNSKAQLEHIEKVWETTKIKQIVPSSLVISLETTSSIQDAIDVRNVSTRSLFKDLVDWISGDGSVWCR
jgi:hypothetical protein